MKFVSVIISLVFIFTAQAVDEKVKQVMVSVLVSLSLEKLEMKL